MEFISPYLRIWNDAHGNFPWELLCPLLGRGVHYYAQRNTNWILKSTYSSQMNRMLQKAKYKKMPLYNCVYMYAIH